MSNAPAIIDIPSDLLDLQRTVAAADADVHARIAEIAREEAEYERTHNCRRPLPTTPDEPGLTDEQLPKLREIRSEAAAAVRARVQELAGGPDRYWHVRAALLAAVVAETP